MRSNALSLLSLLVFVALPPPAAAEVLRLDCTVPQNGITSITVDFARHLVQTETLIAGNFPGNKTYSGSEVEINKSEIAVHSRFCLTEDSHNKCQLAWIDSFLLDRADGSITIREGGCSGPICVPGSWRGNCSGGTGDKDERRGNRDADRSDKDERRGNRDADRTDQAR